MEKLNMNSRKNTPCVFVFEASSVTGASDPKYCACLVHCCTAQVFVDNAAFHVGEACNVTHVVRHPSGEG